MRKINNKVTSDTKNWAKDKIVNKIISILNSNRLPILSARFPITTLPNNPIKVPAPSNPTQKLVKFKGPIACVTAVPAIPRA